MARQVMAYEAVAALVVAACTAAAQTSETPAVPALAEDGAASFESLSISWSVADSAALASSADPIGTIDADRWRVQADTASRGRGSGVVRVPAPGAALLLVLAGGVCAPRRRGGSGRGRAAGESSDTGSGALTGSAGGATIALASRP